MKCLRDLLDIYKDISPEKAKTIKEEMAKQQQAEDDRKKTKTKDDQTKKEKKKATEEAARKRKAASRKARSKPGGGGAPHTKGKINPDKHIKSDKHSGKRSGGPEKKDPRMKW